MLDSDIKSFVKMLDFTGGKYSAKDIFRDVITLEAYMINVALLNSKEYAKQFDELMKKYTISEQKEIWKIILELAELYNKQRQANDIMTEVFSELGLGNKNTGQFFTPTHVSDLMTKIVVGEIDLEKEIKEKGYTTFGEPTCGAGGMILAYAREVKDKGYDTYRNLYVEAWDIDILCTYMTFVQLSMYDIPAKVVNGDTLSLKENFTLFTPAYYVFRHLEKEGKLTVPVCAYCKKEIMEEPKTSQFDKNKKICEQCYSSEQKLLLLKQVIEMK